MARAHDRKRQLKTQKSKTKRELARRKKNATALSTSSKALVARALGAPFGPCWVSAALADELDEEGPALISVIVTRRVGGLLLPCVVLVDRTCLGVKNAFVAAPQTELGMQPFVGSLADAGDPLRPAELLLVQSVIFHAIDHARSLGFEPHRDFVPGLIGERPAVLLDTPLCRPERPLYVVGPRDNVAGILARLDARVGPDGYDLIGGHDVFGGDWSTEDLDDDFDDEGVEEDDVNEDERDVLTTEGIEAPTGEPHESR